ncbi:MAG: polymer-forming cytoskeletal protein [Planctomycetota bacterium]
MHPARHDPTSPTVHTPATPALANARSVRCYHCHEALEVAPKAQTITCPLCYKPLAVADIIIKDTHWGGRLQSCGSIVIKPRARVMAKRILAVHSVEIQGDVQADIECLGLVIVGPRAVYKGKLTAAALRVDDGAVLDCPVLRVDPRFRTEPVDAVFEGTSKLALSGHRAQPEAAERPAAEAAAEPVREPASTAFFEAIARSRNADSARTTPRLALGRTPIVKSYLPEDHARR